MATIFYIRKGSKTARIASSRDVSVEDLLSLYGSVPANYKHMKGADSPTISEDRGTAASGPDAEHVVVRIEGNEVNQDIFPHEGYYMVDVNPVSE